MIPGGLYLVDTSAIARIADPEVHRELTRLGRLGLLATCVTVDLEVLYSARTPAEYAAIAARRAAGFVDLPLNLEIGARARAVQAMLAKRSQHRAAGIVDLLTASAAEHYQAIVLHYDSDFEHIAAVTGQDTRWVVPRGSAG
ncbi:MAG: PIN domain-containing protein [Pseudonocardiaceae bacterium]